jgi:glycosyltransferase involved in cell wall biosynthesis
MGLRIAVDLRGIDPQRPRGPARWARSLAAALPAAGPEHDWTTWEPGATGDPRRADLVLALAGGRPRHGPPTWSAVHDLGHLLARGSFGPLEWARRNWAAAWTARQAERLLAPSGVVAHALHAYLRVPDARITWLPSVPPAGFQRSRRPEVEAVRESLRLGPRWFAVVGTLSRRRNLPMLLAAWQRARPALGPGVDLVVAGAEADPAVTRAVRAGGARAVGYLPDADLRALLSGAIALLDPTPHAGTSIGVLEAMACGAPPVVAAGSAGGEVIGNAGVLVDADDVESWAAAVTYLARETGERNRMAARGLRAMPGFRAEGAARRLVEALGAGATADARAAGSAPSAGGPPASPTPSAPGDSGRGRTGPGLRRR